MTALAMETPRECDSLTPMVGRLTPVVTGLTPMAAGAGMISLGGWRRDAAGRGDRAEPA